LVCPYQIMFRSFVSLCGPNQKTSERFQQSDVNRRWLTLSSDFAPEALEVSCRQLFKELEFLHESAAGWRRSKGDLSSSPWRDARGVITEILQRESVLSRLSRRRVCCVRCLATGTPEEIRFVRNAGCECLPFERTDVEQHKMNLVGCILRKSGQYEPRGQNRNTRNRFQHSRLQLWLTRPISH